MTGLGSLCDIACPHFLTHQVILVGSKTQLISRFSYLYVERAEGIVGQSSGRGAPQSTSHVASPISVQSGAFKNKEIGLGTKKNLTGKYVNGT